MYILCIVMGILSLLYFLTILFFRGVSSSFHYFWLVVSIVIIVFGLEWRFHFIANKIPHSVFRIIKLCFIAGICLFVFVEGCILSSFGAKGEPQLDYIIVLGAQVRENGPSRPLKLRLDCAYEYLTVNEETMVVVSGGQGSDEPTTEALCMKEYLVSRGISKERIIMEEESVNTFQNLFFSKELLPKEVKEIGVVTNNFHVFRSVRIAKKAGFSEACGIAAKSYLPLLPSDMLREFFGVMKDFVMGNM